MNPTHILANANGDRFEVELTSQGRWSTYYDMMIDGERESFQMETVIWNLLAVPTLTPEGQKAIA